MGGEEAGKRILLLMSPATYRAGAFLRAAQSLGLEVVVGLDLPERLTEYWHVPLGLDFGQVGSAVEAIVAYARERPFVAVLSVDDSATEVAAYANAALGLASNSPQASEAARDKLLMRRLLSTGGVPCPVFRNVGLQAEPGWIASQVSYPCVLKPRRLSGSRGVIRANNAEEFQVAFGRVKRLLLGEGVAEAEGTLLVEDFIPGVEVALEGLLTDGQLKVLTLFDKPDPLDGPFFEETIYVTPSRLPEETQQAIAECVVVAAGALGLCTGPVHAELRVNEGGPMLVEIAGRSIGGLCSTILEFGSGLSLEELILRHALGELVEEVEREGQAAGVMMIPIPVGGMYKGVYGVEEALGVPLITGIEITARVYNQVVPLPEGGSYLGFIFARGDDVVEVESALRVAHHCLRFEICRALPMVERRGLREAGAGW
ncbi:ATP-grasp domain-containing protein [Dictyobacter vulcani]|nr:ATP-grasp domain-containing protein [Dictyobacter vulcani]